MTIDNYLSLVNTTQHTYLGYLQQEKGIITLKKTATITGEGTPQQLAYDYFVQAAKRKLETKTVPLTAVESISPQKKTTVLYHSYEELSRTIGRNYGKNKIRRLEKLLGGETL